MDDHYKALFEELTQEDNFKKLMDLRSFYDDVIKPGLINAFWSKVHEKLKEDSNIMKGWKSMFLDKSTIYLYKTSWIVYESQDDPTPFAIVWKQLDGKPFYGVWIDPRVKSVFEKYRTTKELPIFNGRKLQRTDSNYIVWSYYNDSLNFQAQDSLFDFLPSKCENKANEFAKISIELGKAYEKYIDELIDTNEFKF